MILNHDRSIALHTWSVICAVVAVILLVLGLFFAVFDENFTPLGVGVILLVAAPVLNGLSVLVEDAELRLIPRSQEILRQKKEREQARKEAASKPAE